MDNLNTQSAEPRGVNINNLPRDILIKIFCNVDSEELSKTVKKICSSWYSIVDDLLFNMCRLVVPEEIVKDALRLFRAQNLIREDRHTAFFSVYKAPYSTKNIISEDVIVHILSKKPSPLNIHQEFMNLEEKGYVDILMDLKLRSVTKTFMLPLEYRALIRVLTIEAFTGLDLPVSIKDVIDYDNEELKTLLKKYKWYTFETLYMSACAGPCYGLIVLHPDNQIFAILDIAYNFVLDL